MQGGISGVGYNELVRTGVSRSRAELILRPACELIVTLTVSLDRGRRVPWSMLHTGESPLARPVT